MRRTDGLTDGYSILIIRTATRTLKRYKKKTGQLIKWKDTKLYAERLRASDNHLRRLEHAPESSDRL